MKSFQQIAFILMCFSLMFESIGYHKIFVAQEAQIAVLNAKLHTYNCPMIDYKDFTVDYSSPSNVLK